jgi:diguanylate cyclase (GGDEF)-like protein
MGTQRPKELVDPRIAALRTGSASRRPQAWLVFLIGGLGLALGGLLIDDERALLPVLTATGLVATAAILAGARIHRPARHLPWHLLAVSLVLTTIAATFETATGELGVLSQAMTGVGSLAGIVGLAILVRGRIPGGDRAAILDAAILASGIGVLVWAFGLGPYVLAAGQNSVVLAAFFYPALVALATVVRMWFLPGAHRPTTRLLVLFVLAANALIVMRLLAGSAGQNGFSGLYLLAGFAVLTFVATAALHPSMAILPEHQRVDLGPIGWRRIAALGAALLVNPATLAIEVLIGRAIDPAPYLVGGALIGLLVVARLSDALRQLGASLHERESLMELLRRQALYDSLTALPNRSLFTERLATDFANRAVEGQLAVLLVDLDDFKSVNDSYGHEAGDALLVAVGQRLRGAVRSGDMAARFGGDEFVITLPACADPGVPTRVAQRILAALAEPFDIAGRSLTVWASIGVALAGSDDRTPDDLVRNADVAMYLAKSRGKGRFEVFEPSMQAAAMTELQLRADLAAGIAGGDLRLHYQPVVDLRSGRTVGYEALVRWLRDGRLVAPGEFIPVAEASGLIGPLTDWVVDEACRTTARWGTPGDRPWVSINMSSSQLLRHDLVARLGRTLDASGLPPDHLVIEITESSLLDIAVARPAIERLSEIGIRVAIDDFGTGYSALSYLARLHIDIIKIDRSFVAALEQEAPEEAIAAAIIALAKRLGLMTIGEGIETATQLEQLAALGCDLGQGYYLGRPAADEDLRQSPLPQGQRQRAPVLVGLSA